MIEKILIGCLLVGGWLAAAHLWCRLYAANDTIRMLRANAAATTQENQPVAWEVYWEGAARVPYLVSASEKPSEHWEPPPRCVPLYRQCLPALTDAEREAVEASREFWQVEADAFFDPLDQQYANILRGLLERTEGGRN